ncbi:probable G-protein coupled receptor 139 [Hypanus sabinus]|uniref:probable G-protein coupled receptor 139 n=1 Tax=Hypanus sabinus TaxID=79690 RepID=UPI0028C471E3|nr:probable G-protein coupled receptor 139 [Hypanus sabinus]
MSQLKIPRGDLRVYNCDAPGRNADPELQSERPPTACGPKMLETFNSARRICYLIIAIIGLPVNLVAIAILSRGKCGLSSCTTRYLVVMAAADMLAVVTAVILMRISYYFPGSYLDRYPTCNINFFLMCAARDCSVWFTVAFSFDRFVLICCQKLKTKYCTLKTAAAVLAITGVLLCLKNVPFYFSSEPKFIIDKVPWFCKRKRVYYTDPLWVGFRMLDKVVTPLLPLAFILLFNVLTVRHILLASRVRKALRGQSKGQNQSDPEMESRRRSMILLFTISGSFILLWLTTVLDFLYYNIAGTTPSQYNNSEFIFAHVGYMLQNFSLCTNTFIYGVTQSKFRQEFVNAVKYPVNSILRIIKK